ncbi:hypothetical protein [Streptomyces sp. NPDC016845]|uniref:hypothetical protein n=1 Tax=Streptomyces sp. NPDC016845 TaxID=3364972 RepID=UPI0037882420
MDSETTPSISRLELARAHSRALIHTAAQMRRRARTMRRDAAALRERAARRRRDR